MLHILLLILKIAGFLLLAILGLFLLAVLTVLFVPVRYRGQGSFYGEPKGSFQVTWLLRLLSLCVTYDGEAEIRIRILGFSVFQEKEKAGKAEPEEEPVFDRPAMPEEPVLSAQDLETRPPRDPKEEYENTPPIRSIPQEPEHPSEEASEEAPPGNNFFHRVAEKIRGFFRRMALAFRNLCEGLKKAEAWKEAAVSFVQDEENRKTYLLIKKQLKKVLRHILPVKLKGTVTFGFEEPYTTGQILTWAALLYPLYRDKFVLCPVFDRQILEGEVSLKGRIRMGTLLMAGIRILLNKNFRKQLKRFLNRGGL